MSVVVLIRNRTAVRVIGRIDIDAFDPFPVPSLHETQRLKVVAAYENAVNMVIQIFNARLKPLLKRLSKEACIYGQHIVRPKEFHCERHCIGGHH